MKRAFFMLALAGALVSACNKKNTPPDEPAQTTSVSDMNDEELARMKADKQRMKAEIDARAEKQAAFEEERDNNAAADAAKASKMGYIKVTAVDGSALAGCGWLLKLSNGKKIQPASLPPAHQKNGKELWVKYEASEVPTTCQTGKAVRLLDIQWKDPNGGE